jgi:nucleoside 2-deoxyribosyltransferase
MKAYIASPFFNEEQLERVKFIEEVLKKIGFEYFSPRLDTYVKPDSTQTEREIAFNDNLRGIEKADFIIVVTDGKDVGTIFEAGYAFNEHIPILYFAETLGDKPFNLMLAMSAELGTCKSRAELQSMLIDIDNCASISEYILKTNKNFEGEIE